MKSEKKAEVTIELRKLKTFEVEILAVIEDHIRFVTRVTKKHETLKLYFSSFPFVSCTLLDIYKPIFQPTQVDCFTLKRNLF